MSELGVQDFNRVPQRDVGASQAAVGRAVAPRTNEALRLAENLADLNPNLRQLGIAISQEDKAVQAAAAKKRALETGGKELAEAVRSGEIAPTQNPFYVQSYNEEAAYVRAQKAISDLTLQSSSWAEKNDHQAFSARFSRELAEIGKTFGNDPDTATGFNSAAAPALQQAIAANTAQAAAAMERDRLANISQLIVGDLTETQKAHAGKASPQQLLDSLADTKERFISTGGTEADWAKLVYQGFTSTAYNTSDPDLLDKLPDSIKALPGVADSLSSDKYRIEQDKTAELRAAAEEARNRVTVQGQQIFTNAYKKYGLSLIQGNVSFAQLAADNPGMDPLSIAAALNTVQSATADNQSLDIARIRSYGASSSGGSYLLDLHIEAATQGITPELTAKVGALVAQRQISAQDGSQLIDKAIDTTKALNQQPGAVFPTPGLGIKVAQGAVNAAIKPYDDLRRATDAEATTMVQWVNKSARVAGNPPVPVAVTRQLQIRMANAAAQWLASHPGDFPGARRAAQSENGRWFVENAETYTKPQKAQPQQSKPK